MSKYKIVKKITSVNVSIGTLRELESYIKHQIESLMGSSEEYSFEITITDANGKETFDTLEKYSSNYLPNSIEIVEVSCYLNYRPAISIYLTANGFYWYMNEITIELHGENLKEKAIGIYTNINSILNENKNSNTYFYWYHTYPLVSLWLVLLVFLVMSFVMLDNFKYLQSVQFYSFVAITSFIVFASLSPYIVFDTPKNKKNSSIRRFILKSAFSIFGVSTLAAIFLNYIQL